MRILIQTIPHKHQRYPTVGDYHTDEKGTERIYVSDMGDWRYELLVAVHELIEDFLCKNRGITEESITEFDIQYEKERAEGKHGENDEPGFDKNAPYKNEHHFATGIEILLAKELGVNWNEYEKKVESL